MKDDKKLNLSRRDLLKIAAVGGAASAVGGSVLAPRNASAQTAATGCSGLPAIEAFPTSPLILNPFSDPLPIPSPLRPVSLAELTSVFPAPGSGPGQQDSRGGTHQIWPSALGLPDPIFYVRPVPCRRSAFARALRSPRPHPLKEKLLL